jgi:ethanolamine ammonia-lyase large subunit
MRRCEVVTKFRNTLRLRGRLATRLQPNNPTDDGRGIAASMLARLLYGSGDAVIGTNPATDNVRAVGNLLRLMDAVREQYTIPTQICMLYHVTATLQLIGQNAPVDLAFQSITGTHAANTSFGIGLELLNEAREATLALNRGTVERNVMCFEKGQGSALSANVHHCIDQQTCDAWSCAVARRFEPLLVNSVVGFIGPEYFYNGKQIIRAALEDHFCGKLLGLPMGMDIYHAEADKDDMDTLLTLLGVAGCNFIVGVPGADGRPERFVALTNRPTRA